MKKRGQHREVGPHNRAFALVEALVAAAILSTVLAFSMGAYLLSAEISGANGAKVESAFLADEGVEAVRVLRDSNWSANIAPLTAGTAYHLAWNGTTWAATSTDVLIDGKFERTFVLGNVYRDSNYDIAQSGTLDSSTRMVTITVSWGDHNATSSKALTAYITNIFNN